VRDELQLQSSTLNIESVFPPEIREIFEANVLWPDAHTDDNLATL